jgi:hypothetical protein
MFVLLSCVVVLCGLLRITASSSNLNVGVYIHQVNHVLFYKKMLQTYFHLNFGVMQDNDDIINVSQNSVTQLKILQL